MGRHQADDGDNPYAAPKAPGEEESRRRRGLAAVRAGIRAAIGTFFLLLGLELIVVLLAFPEILPPSKSSPLTSWHRLAVIGFNAAAAVLCGIWVARARSPSKVPIMEQEEDDR
jgi:hypothetical protein